VAPETPTVAPGGARGLRAGACRSQYSKTGTDEFLQLLRAGDRRARGAQACDSIPVRWLAVTCRLRVGAFTATAVRESRVDGCQCVRHTMPVHKEPGSTGVGRAVSIGTGRVLPLLLGLATIEAASACGRGSTWAVPAADLPADAPVSAQPSERTRDPRPPDGPDTQWIAGRHYEKLQPIVAELSATATPPATGTSRTKVTVVEFFWYACRHCFELEPHLEEWLRNRPGDVEFVRIPVAWHARQDAHARLFYTLRALGRDELDGHVFAAIHEQKHRLVAESEEETLRLQLAFAEANGVSPRDFAAAWRSAQVEKELERARQLTKACRIDAVPAIVINGEYLSTAGRAGGKPQLMRLVAILVSQELARAQ